MAASKLDRVNVGDSTTSRRVVAAEDVLAFAALTGDAERIHVDEAYAATTPYRRRIVHGVLLLGQLANGLLLEERVGPNLSLGYDRIRFIRPIFVGDPIVAHATVIEKREEKAEIVVEEKIIDNEDKLALIAVHIYRFI